MSECLETEDVKELYVQDGVLLFSAAASFINLVKSMGSLMLTEYADGNKCIEWKPIDVTVDSNTQDQEWALVNTVDRRVRTLSGTVSDLKNRSKYLIINLDEIKSFRVSDKSRRLTLYDGRSEQICIYWFQHGNCDFFVGCLKSMVKTVPSKRDKHIFQILSLDNPEQERIDKSFAELNVCTDSAYKWKLWGNLQERPIVATFEAFSKITDLVYRNPEHREIDEDDVKEILNRSVTEYESTATTHSQGEYEVIDVPDLPQRRDFPRGKPLNLEQWRGVQDNEGRIEDSECLKMIIFQGGIIPTLRQDVWKYLLDYYPWNSTNNERQKVLFQKNEEYYSMKLQWKTMTKTQENNFTDYKERKTQIEKDVNRTDRTIDYYAGNNNPNLQVLSDILMTYVMYNFDLGYVQGMSDLLSPILHLIQSEVDAFWCFVGFMNKLSSNFDADQVGMKEQLSNLHTLLAFIDPDLATYFDNHDSGNMFFCFRWLLVWFKRELSEENCLAFWEVLWTGFPCENFHLLVSCAILTQEKDTIINNNYGFTEILKHINELSGQLDVEKILNDAQGIYYQIKESEHLTDVVRLLLGLPILGHNSFDNHETSPFEESIDASNSSASSQPKCSVDNVRISPDEVHYEKALSSNFL